MSITTAPGSAVETWVVDPVHSTVGFAVKHMVVSTFRGRFEEYAAVLRDVDGRVQLTGSVDVGSIVVKDQALADHLQAPDFFDAANHPTLEFASDGIAVGGDGAVEITGQLTIKGRTRPVRAAGRLTAGYEDPFGGVRRGLELEAVIDRRAYGLEWNLPLPKGGFALGDDVRLIVDLEFTRP